MKLPTTFSLAVLSDQPPGLINRVVNSVTPPVSHAIGVGSGLTGLALWAELAKHCTIIVGLLVTLAALVGGIFYAVYWAIKALREWRDLRSGMRRRR